MSITVIDAIMGAGKTSWAIQEMNDQTDKSFIYCTPLLSEIDRVKEQSTRYFSTPQYCGGRKIDNFNDLLMDGKDIVVSHATFANATNLTIELLKGSNYVLILDETLDILLNFNDVTKDSINRSDIILLLKEGFISVDQYGKVSWLKDSYMGSKFYNVERMAKQGNLFYLNETLLVWQFPPIIFKTFKEIYVLTYLFKGSFLKPYFEYHGLNYTKASVEQDADGVYRLTDWMSDKNQRKQYASLINIYDNKSANNYKAFSLSRRWFDNANSSKIKTLKNNIYSYFHNAAGAKSPEIMWTCPKDYHKALKGKGYTVTRRLTKEESQLPKTQKEKLEKQLSCFVPCNARATNDYQDRTTLAYVINLFANPFVCKYFSNKNFADGLNIEVDQEYFALSQMLQWIWRSQIRTGKPIQIYIPSRRMRDLLTAWTKGEM